MSESCTAGHCRPAVHSGHHPTQVHHQPSLSTHLPHPTCRSAKYVQQSLDEAEALQLQQHQQHYAGSIGATPEPGDASGGKPASPGLKSSLALPMLPIAKITHKYLRAPDKHHDEDIAQQVFDMESGKVKVGGWLGGSCLQLRHSSTTAPLYNNQHQHQRAVLSSPCVQPPWWQHGSSPTVLSCHMQQQHPSRLPVLNPDTHPLTHSHSLPLHLPPPPPRSCTTTAPTASLPKRRCSACAALTPR